MINAVIDLSHHNQIASFDQVKAAGILGVILKATQGTTFVDPTFAANRNAAEKAGLLVGAYHFGIAGDPVAQAEFLIATAGKDRLLVLDFESNPQGAELLRAQGADTNPKSAAARRLSSARQTDTCRLHLDMEGHSHQSQSSPIAPLLSTFFGKIIIFPNSITARLNKTGLILLPTPAL